MATNAFVSVGTLSTNQVLTAYDRVAFFALRDNLIFDQFTTVKGGDLTSPGSPVQFTFWTEMTAATTALTETVDVDAVSLSDSTVTVTPSEYGNAVLMTVRIRVDDMLLSFESDVANLVAWNMALSIDTLARAGWDGAGTATTVAASEAATVAGDVLTVNAIRQKAAQLRGANVVPIFGQNYASVMHPDVAYDIMTQTGDGAWVAPAQYQNAEKIYNGEIGTLAGFKIMTSPTADVNADGGSGTVDTYTTNFFGQEAVAKAESIPPHIVLGPVTDKLKRFQPLGWHAYVGWGQFRSAASRRHISSSSIGSN
jgi:N4-gp56 family major capsid protein